MSAVKGIVQYGHFAARGVLRCASALFGEIYGVPAWTKEVESLRTFCVQEGGGSIFRDIVRTSFMDGPLYKIARDGASTKRVRIGRASKVHDKSYHRDEANPTIFILLLILILVYFASESQ